VRLRASLRARFAWARLDLDSLIQGIRRGYTIASRASSLSSAGALRTQKRLDCSK
jgi:hypothetical protein